MHSPQSPVVARRQGLVDVPMHSPPVCRPHAALPIVREGRKLHITSPAPPCPATAASGLDSRDAWPKTRPCYGKSADSRIHPQARS